MSEPEVGENHPRLGAALAKAKGVLLHPFTVILVLALAIRLVIMPVLSHNYDVSYWALIIRNIQSGNGLYQVTGYYYTPVWGYFLGVMGKACALLGVDVSVVRFDDLLMVEDAWWPFYVANLTNVSFNVLVKTPLIICDAVVGYLVYWLIKDRTGDSRKALIGMALWLFCPVIVFLSAAHGMFDTISVLFTLLTVILVYKERYFLAGATFSAAILTKFFPLYLMFVFVAFILRKHRGDLKEASQSLVYAILGFFAMTLLIYAPVILENSVSDSFLFLTNRLGEAIESGPGGHGVLEFLTITAKSLVFLIQPLILGLVIYTAYRFYDSDGPDVEADFLRACMFSLALAFAWPSSPQYLVVLIPLLIYHVVAVDKTYLTALLAVGLGAALADLFMCNSMLLLSFSKYTGLISIDTIMSIYTWMEAPLIFGAPRMLVLILAAGLLQMGGIWMVLYKGFLEHRRSRRCASDE